MNLVVYCGRGSIFPMNESRDDINTKDFTIERASKVDEQYDKTALIGKAIHLNRLRVRGAMNLRLRSESDVYRITLGAEGQHE